MAKFSVCRIYKVTLWLNFSYNYSVNLLQILHLYIHPLGSSGHKKKRAREKETREGRGSSLNPCVSPSRAPVLSFARYFQAPATQAREISDGIWPTCQRKRPPPLHKTGQVESGWNIHSRGLLIHVSVIFYISMYICMSVFTTAFGSY